MDPGLRAKGLLAGYELVETERINGMTNMEISSSGFVLENHLTHKTLRNNNQGARGFWHRFRVATLMNVKARETRFIFSLYFLGLCVFYSIQLNPRSITLNRLKKVL